MNNASRKVMKFLVYRQEKITPSNFTVITASVSDIIKNDGDLVNELREGVTKWAKETEDGQEAYEYAGNDMNIGDLSGYDLAPILANCPNIFELSFENIEDARNWIYDTSLCDEIKQEEGTDVFRDTDHPSK